MGLTPISFWLYAKDNGGGIKLAYASFMLPPPYKKIKHCIHLNYRGLINLYNLDVLPLGAAFGPFKLFCLMVCIQTIKQNNLDVLSLDAGGSKGRRRKPLWGKHKTLLLEVKFYTTPIQTIIQ